MSTIQGNTYDFPATVTASDTVDDPAGPFTGLYVNTTGALRVTPYAGPLASSSVTLQAVAGQYIRFPVRRVWSTTTVASVVGLVGPVVRQGQ